MTKCLGPDKDLYVSTVIRLRIKVFVAAGQMRSMIDELIARTNSSSEILARAERLGMEVSQT
jgi:hypothetical protein